MSPEPVRVCFVCLGNICRSPTAEGVMRQRVTAAGLSEWIEVESAGTAAYHKGELPDKRARAAARQRGVMLDSRARQFVEADFLRFDYVLAMDAENLDHLLALRGDPESPCHLGLLRAFDPLAPSRAEVPDPYYGGPNGFEDVLDLCAVACDGLLRQIRQEHELG